ncbi:MAG TPA: alpha/beta hydrolase [Acidimicrobiales bacterium]|nr:alpha/beta hydrolase [Acidimicrobiales bacterium]
MEWTTVAAAKGATCRVLKGGSGPDLVFLHGAGGLTDDDPFLVQLADSHSVYAPELPGFGESTGEELLEDMLDFTLHSLDVIDALGLDAPVLAGHSMGGMIAAEVACVCPHSVGRLVLLAPAGLWLDSDPVADIFSVLPHDLPGLLFHDPVAGAGLLGGGLDFSDDEALIEFFVDNARRLGTAGKILFPIPDRRLSKRLYRLRAETLLVWGESDRVIPPVYASAWAAALPVEPPVVVLPEAGHMLTVEQPKAAAEAVLGWLTGLGVN